MSLVTGTRSLLAGALVGLLLSGRTHAGSARTLRRTTRMLHRTTRPARTAPGRTTPRRTMPGGAPPVTTTVLVGGQDERSPGTCELTIACPDRAALEVRVSVGGRAATSPAPTAGRPAGATVTVRVAAPRGGHRRTVQITPAGTPRAYVAYDIAQVA
ncbi:hypothetical protein [Arsenicicoccus dermatophilus]|uniref:hypothetical protein n=1 Tax=Arsenicicoccus dermatophilus TaxID=1076331 RepID=UPI001F4C5739|nr:hypothetical protein [Arsenicicoccus dermatophilus]MCH8613538.1 hypothetical protein [Arsenicicoccus dermatophilus]